MELVKSFALNGVPSSMLAFRSPGRSTDYLMLSFLNAKVSVVEYDQSSQDIKTVSLHFLEEPWMVNSKATFASTPVFRADPDGRCACFLAYDSKMVILPFDGSSLQDLRMIGKRRRLRSDVDDLDLPVRRNLVIDLDSDFGIRNVKDYVFLDGYLDPTLLILHEPNPTWTGRLAVRRDTCVISALTLRLDSAEKPAIATWFKPNLPHDCTFVLSVPTPQSGVVVCGPNSMFYANQTSLSGFSLNDYAIADWPESIQLVPVNKTCSFAGATFLLIDQTTVLVSLPDGQYHLASLVFEGRSVRQIRISQLGTASVASSMVLAHENHLFIGSRMSDSLLLKFEKQLVSAKDEKAEDATAAETEDLPKPADADEKNGHQDAEGAENPADIAEEDAKSTVDESTKKAPEKGPNDPMEVFSFPPHRDAPYKFELVDIIGNPGPIIDLANGFIGEVNAKQTALATIRSSGQTSSVGLLQRAVVPNLRLTIEGDYLNSWSIRTSGSGPNHSFIVCRKLDGLSVFQTATDVHEVDHKLFHFDVDSPTVYISNVGKLDDFIVQVCEKSLVVLRGARAVERAVFPGNEQAYSATMLQSTLFVLTKRGNVLIYIFENNRFRMQQHPFIPVGAKRGQVTSISPLLVDRVSKELRSGEDIPDDDLASTATKKKVLKLGQKDFRTVSLEVELFGMPLEELRLIEQQKKAAAAAAAAAAEAFAHAMDLDADSSNKDQEARVDGREAFLLLFVSFSSGLMCIYRVSDGAEVWSSAHLLSGQHTLRDMKNSLAEFPAADSDIEFKVPETPNLRIPNIDGPAESSLLDAGPSESDGMRASGDEVVLSFVESMCVRFVDERLLFLVSLSTNEVFAYVSFFFAKPGDNSGTRYSGLSFSRIALPVTHRDFSIGEMSIGIPFVRTVTPSDTQSIFQIQATTEDMGSLSMAAARSYIPRFVPFDNLPENQFGAIWTGLRPLFFFANPKSIVRCHPLAFGLFESPSSTIMPISSLRLFSSTSLNAIRSFCQFSNYHICHHGFTVVDQRGRLRVCELSQHFDYSSFDWPFRSVPLHGWSPTTILYHARSHTFAVGVYKPVPRPRPSDELTLFDEGNRYNPAIPIINVTDPSLRLPNLWNHKFELRLYSASDWSFLDRFEIANFHQLLTTNVVHLAGQNQDGKLDTNVLVECLALGAANFDGEDIHTKGRLTLLRVVESRSVRTQDAEAEDTKRGRHRFLHLLTDDITYGPVTALDSMDGMLLLTAGRKLYLYEYNWVERRLDIDAFLDIDYFTTGMSKIRQYVLLGDVQRGFLVVRWRPQGRVFKALCHDPISNNGRSSAVEYLIDDQVMYMTCADEEHNVLSFTFTQTNVLEKESERGLPATLVSGIHVGQRINRMLRFACKRVKGGAYPVSANPPFRMGILGGCASGALIQIAPIPETTYRRLVSLSTFMQTGVPQVAGLHPREFRSVHSSSMDRKGMVKRGCLDMDLVYRFLSLDAHHQRDLARRIGASVESIREGIAEIEVQTGVLQ
eukprot:ANDGO_00970.mRNA.1 Cleavage and polyadenylation specificity factor subunit 1